MSEEVARVATCPVHEINPMHPEVLKSPWMMNRRLRKEAPVFQDPNSGIFFISRYEDVVKMAMDHETFSSRMLTPSRALTATQDKEIQEVVESGYPNVPTMLTEDPPAQRRYRKFVDGAFSPKALKALEPYIESLSNELIDNFIDDGKCEFLSDFGVPLPLRVIVSQLGAPEEDLPLFRKWTDAFIGNLSQQLDRDGLLQAAKDMVEFQHYFVERMEERRAEPQDDILSKVVNASFDGEKPLDNAECLSMLSQILVAGNETTSATLTEGIWLLIQNPDQYELIKNDPSEDMISRFVEESLRYSSPSSNMFRRTTKDVEMHGITIPENSVLFARFASANQDSERFPEPEKFNLMRDNLREQVAFGKGVHHCLGAALSRREMNVGFKVIFERMENFRLQEDASEPQFSANALLHGLTGLDLAFDKVG
ncbi:MAG: cytochrome P450 [Pseudomonadales bacterium]|nr:cytochrome P450 [Pseudomonadales bacterium]MBO6594459.1 cytochrome P450 [Pseudomonadales bacterium]MBO6821980.1 cytochrome P450 [Pseudomonadales bacterium]